MDNSDTVLLSLVVFSVIGFFVFGMLYIKKMLRKEQSVLRAIAVPMLVGFVLGAILLFYAFSLT